MENVLQYLKSLSNFIINFHTKDPWIFWIILAASAIILIGVATFILRYFIKRARNRKIRTAKERRAELIEKAAAEVYENNRLLLVSTPMPFKNESIGNVKQPKKAEPQKSQIQINTAIKDGLSKTKIESPKDKNQNMVAHEGDVKTKKSTERLPGGIIGENPDIEIIRRVNYSVSSGENLDSYPVLRVPKMGCVVRTHRLGSTKRRGYKEESFQTTIEHFFGSNFIVSGNVRLNTGNETRPFEPDIALIEKGNSKNIRIDIEIDEPYAGITRQPTHCKGDDLMRDTYFVDRGWIVIRFSEYQVHTQEIECLKYVASIIKAIDNNYHIPGELNTKPNLKAEQLWSILQAQKWEKEKYREEYLGHVFSELTEKQETVERDFNKQEAEEEKQVVSSINGKIDNGRIIGYNKDNIHHRDSRIVFYPDNHIYTVDGKPVPSASTVISRFFPEFDAVYWARIKAPKKGLTSHELVKEWEEKGKEAAKLGTNLHEQIENYFLESPFVKTKEFHLFENFIKDHSNVKPYRTEWRIFDEHYGVAGTIDFLSKNSHDFEIYDWKRSNKVVDPYYFEPIRDNRFQSGIGILRDIPDTSFNRYTLQQSLYRYILERNYNLKISKMFLVVIHPDYDRYYKVETPYWKDKVEYILKSIN